MSFDERKRRFQGLPIHPAAQQMAQKRAITIIEESPGKLALQLTGMIDPLTALNMLQSAVMTTMGIFNQQQTMLINPNGQALKAALEPTDESEGNGNGAS